MIISIYQIELSHDRNGIAFESWDMMIKHQGELKPEIYYLAYHNKIEAKDLEDVYYIFNAKRPDDFHGHSLSVSDIVWIHASDEVEPGFYYCDSIGFEKIDFDPEKAIY